MPAPNKKQQKCAKNLMRIFEEFEEKMNEHQANFPELKFYTNDARILAATCPTEPENVTDSSGFVDGDCILNDVGYVIAVRKSSNRFECNTCLKIENSIGAIRDHHKNVHVGEYKTHTLRNERSAKMSKQ